MKRALVIVSSALALVLFAAARTGILNGILQGNLDAANNKILNQAGLPVVSASNFSGANAGEQIAAATASLPSSGGTVDASGITGAQIINTDIFAGSATKPIKLILGAATYTVTASAGADMIVLHGNQRIVGAGPGLTVIKVGSQVTTQNGVITIATNSTDAGVENLTIDGGLSATPYQFGIQFHTGCVRPVIRNVNVINLHATISHIYVESSTDGKFDNIWIVAPGLQGHGFSIFNTTPSNDNHQLSNITVFDGGFGFHLVQTSRNSISNCVATATSFTSFEGFNLNSAHENTFSNITAWGRGDAGYIEAGGDSYPGLSKRNHIIGGTFGRNKNDGVSLTSLNGVYENISTFDNGQGGGASPQHGVFVGGGCSGVTLNGITAWDDQGGGATQRVGVYIDAGASNTTINGGTYSGNPDGDVQNFDPSSRYDETAWTAPTLLNLWVNYGTPNQTAGYIKNVRGVVTIKGLIKSGTVTAGTSLFTLPARYRPTEDLYFTVGGLTATPVVIGVIASNGNVVLATTGTPSLSLSGISFSGN